MIKEQLYCRIYSEDDLTKKRTRLKNQRSNQQPNAEWAMQLTEVVSRKALIKKMENKTCWSTWSELGEKLEVWERLYVSYGLWVKVLKQIQQ